MFISLLRERRSIRKFSTKPIEHEKMNVLAEAILRSPSSRGINPWEFIFVTDKELLKKLSKAKTHGSDFLKNAPAGIIICSSEEKSDVWVEDTSIASIITILSAQSIGLGSCWIQIRNRMHNDEIKSEDYIADLLNIPKGIRVESIIAVGYPDEKKEGHPVETLQYEKIFLNKYGLTP